MKNQNINLINEAKNYYLSISNNIILDSKQTAKNRVKLTVFNEIQNYKGFIWIKFDSLNMYLCTEIGTHGSKLRGI
jgi:hypothetical protein